jgi:hypothetical protein
MTSRINRLVVVLLITAITGIAAMAKSKTEKVTLLNDLKVNGTVIKKGTYSVKFDETTSELSILKDGKTIAKAPAKIEKRNKKASRFEIRSTGAGSSAELTAVAFGGSDENIVVGSSAAQNTPN